MKIAQKKKEKICEQIIFYLFSENPKAIFTSHIANEIARDEGYIKKLLLELKDKKIVTEIKKNKEGYNYLKRTRWKLTPEIFESFKQIQGK